MSIRYIALSGLFYLIPGMIETFHYYSENCGNNGITKGFLDIKSKRDLVYITFLSSITLLLLPFKITRTLSFISFGFSLYFYFNAIKKWHPYS